MRVSDGGLRQINFDGMRSGLIMALHFHLDARPVRAIPFHPSLLVNVRPVIRGVNRHVKLRGELIAFDPAYDVQRLADGQLTIHSGGVLVDAMLKVDTVWQ